MEAEVDQQCLSFARKKYCFYHWSLVTLGRNIDYIQHWYCYRYCKYKTLTLDEDLIHSHSTNSKLLP